MFAGWNVFTDCCWLHWGEPKLQWLCCEVFWWECRALGLWIRDVRRSHSRFIPSELKRISHLDRYLSSIRLKTLLTPYPWGSHCVPHCLWPRVVSGSQYLLALLFFLPQCCLLYFPELSQNSEWTSSTSGGTGVTALTCYSERRDGKTSQYCTFSVHSVDSWYKIITWKFLLLLLKLLPVSVQPERCKIFCKSATQWHEGSSVL